MSDLPINSITTRRTMRWNPYRRLTRKPTRRPQSPGRFQPRLVALEDRCVPSALLVKDIRPGSISSSISGGSSFATQLTDINGTAFFVANDGAHGNELWKSDGTTAGTVLVKDIDPTFSSSPQNLTNVNGALFFTANDGIRGGELWKSDGTAAGTVLVKDIRPGSFSDPPYNLTNMNGTLYFWADDGTHGFELWKSDGTETGTVMVKDIYPGPGSGVGGWLANVNGTVLFFANDGSGIGLWKSDGTDAGTGQINGLVGASGSPAVVNGSLFFSAIDPNLYAPTHGAELWKSDGTAAGTVLVKDIRPGIDNSYIDDLTAVNGTIFFAADDGTHGFELWKSDGTETGTMLVRDINPGTAHGTPDSTLFDVNGTLFFNAIDGESGSELWKSDGTEAGTVRIKDINPGAASSVPASVLYHATVNGLAYFRANDGVHGDELWQSDGTAAGTVLTQDINPSGPGFPTFLTNVGGALLFSAFDGVHGIELWRLGSAAPVNHPPVANNDSATTPEDMPVIIAVLANDTDTESNALTAVLVSGPSHGMLTLNANGSFTYTPAANYNGPDSFSYKANDLTADSNVANVAITVTPVNDAPVANADGATTPEDAPVVLAVLANDTDVDGDALMVSEVTQGGHGAVVINGDGTLTYIPAADFFGPDSFTYTVSDGHGGTATATVGLTVTPVNDAPTVAVPSARTAYEDVVLAIGGISIGDVDNGSLSVILSVSDGTLTMAPATGLTVGGNGTAVLTVSGTIASLNAALAGLSYRGALNFGGSDTLSITVSDGSLSAAANVAIHVQSAAEQAAALQAQVNALQVAGVLNQGQANSLNAKLRLKDSAGDIDRVQGFLEQVNDLLHDGILTQAQADALMQFGTILLTSVTRR